MAHRPFSSLPGTRFLQSAVAIAALALLTLGTAPAAAQSNRTFVSGHGADSGGCGLAAPCRSFAFAYNQTNAGGEITVLDPAGYGTLTIAKAISIVNDGVGEAGITAGASGAAIQILAGGTDVVNLRGLTLVGNGVGTTGVEHDLGGFLNIQNCVIRGFTGDGILISAPTVSVTIGDTVLSGNGASGVLFGPTGGGVLSTATFLRVQALGNGFSGFYVSGLLTGGTVQATAEDSVASGNVNSGYLVSSAAGKAAALFAVTNSEAAGSIAGFEAGGAGATFFLDRVTSSGNATYGFYVDANSTIKSFGNNDIVATLNFGSLTPVNPQ